MIRPFQRTDLGYFLPNEWSNPDKVLDVLFDPSYTTMTLWDEKAGMVSAFLTFRNYWGNCWMGFFLISQDLKPRQAIEIRNYVDQTMIEKNAARLQTHSVACDALDRWHRFMKFDLEGCCRKMLFNKDYNIWARVRKED